MRDAGLEVRAFFTSRLGGVSRTPFDLLNLAVHVGDDATAVSVNRGVVAEHAGAPVTYLSAEHGVRVAYVDAAMPDPPADVLVATKPGVAIAAIAADCAPVLLHDSGSGAVAAVHVGREGLYRGVVDAAIAALLDIRGGWRAGGELSASIGPAICGRCYEVPPEMRERVASRHPAARATTSWGTASLDVPRAIEARLGELGVAQILRHQICTYEDLHYYSHRRDGETGRFAGVIVCGGRRVGPQADARRDVP